MLHLISHSLLAPFLPFKTGGIWLLCCIHAESHIFCAKPCPLSYPTCGGPAEQRLGADGRARRLVQELLDMQHLPAIFVVVSQNTSLCITAQLHVDRIVCVHQYIPELGRCQIMTWQLRCVPSMHAQSRAGLPQVR